MERPAGSTSSTDETSTRRVRVGVIVGAHGLEGELRVALKGADPESFAAAETVWLAREESERDATPYALRRVAPGRAGECRVALTGVRDRTAAEALRGCWLLVRAGDLAATEPGEYYVHELLGCRVEAAGGRPLGVVREISSNGASDVLVIEDASGRTHLVPAVAALLLEVDVAARRIVIDAIPGLLGGDA